MHADLPGRRDQAACDQGLGEAEFLDHVERGRVPRRSAQVPGALERRLEQQYGDACAGEQCCTSESHRTRADDDDPIVHDCPPVPRSSGGFYAARHGIGSAAVTEVGPDPGVMT